MIRYGLKRSLGRKCLKLLNLCWDKFMIEEFKEIKNIYDIPEDKYKQIYWKVCKRIAKPSCILRRVGGYQLADETLGEKMALDCLFALVD